MAKTTETVSPYNFAKIASTELGRKIVPQQVYALVRKGTIASTVNELGHLQITIEAGMAHFNKAAKEEKVA
jgi:hypothetical protein